MKATITIFGTLLISLSAFGGVKDLRIMNKLIQAGLTQEPGMGQVHVAIKDLSCAVSLRNQQVECNGIDMGANGGSEAPIALSGKKAQIILNLLTQVGAKGDSGMGKMFYSASMINCSQSRAEISDGSASERTACAIDLESK